MSKRKRAKKYKAPERALADVTEPAARMRFPVLAAALIQRRGKLLDLIADEHQHYQWHKENGFHVGQPPESFEARLVSFQALLRRVGKALVFLKKRRDGKVSCDSERIEQAALLDNTETLMTLPCPVRHHDLFRMFKPCGYVTQGFMTNRGRFVKRDDALVIARAAGQVKKIRGSVLCSEDLW